ncbi:hypothetical protein PMAYCL1PPCAC_30022, partial [Pristionchus mayeri]
NGDEEVEDASPPTEDESSQLQIDSQERAEEKLENGKLAVTFPHCHICGFDRETMFMKEKKAQSGQFKNKVIYRNRCVRKKCNRFFGPSYVYNGKAADFMKISEQSAALARPFENGPREEKYPAEDYEKAAPSGVRYPPDNNCAQMRATKAANKLATIAAPSSSSGAARSVQKASTSKVSSKASTSKMSTSKKSKSKTPAAKKSTAPKKPRKGYSYIEDIQIPAQANRVLEFYRFHEEQKAAEEAKARAAKEKAKRSWGTQTGDEEHIVQILIDELKGKASFRGLKPSDEGPMPANMSNRLVLTQKVLRDQTQTIKTLRKEREFLKVNLKKVVEWVTEYREDLVSDATRLKEDVQVVNRELKNFSLEMQNEANKDIRDLNKLKMQMADRIDDMDRITKKVEASLEYQKSVTIDAEILADRYHRISVDLEKDVIKAQVKARDIGLKLDDKLYLTNNAKCTHCKVNIQIKNMLTEQVADKTLSNTNLSRERETISKELKNLKLVHSIVSKENNQLKFELKAWESNSHKLKSELDQLKGNKAGVQLVGEAAFTPPTPRQSTGLPSATPTHKENEEEGIVEKNGAGEVASTEMDRPVRNSSNSSAEEGEYKSPHSVSPNTLARLPPPPVPPPASKMNEKEKEKEPSPEHAAAFANWIPKERRVPEVPPEMVEAMKKVEESLARGPPPKKEKKDEKTAGIKRGGGPPPYSSNAHHKNGEKKPKLDVPVGKDEKGGDVRTISTIGSSSKGTHPTPAYKEKEKERKREERTTKPSPSPFSIHEPAFPAVVTKKAVKVPYNGPSSLVAASSAPSSSSLSSSPKKKKHLQMTPEKKPQMSFLPVAGSSALPPPQQTPRERDTRSVPLDAILREAERLRQIEREREMRREREQQTAALHRVYDHVAASVAAAERRTVMQPRIAGGVGRMGDMDDDLPWNQGRAATYHQPHRPATPVQDWYDAPAGQAPPPRAHSPRFYDPTFDPRAPRDQFGRLEPDFGVLRPHHSSSLPPSHLLPHSLAPPLHRPPSPSRAPPPQDSAWRREWHQPNWSDEPPRRGYWD